MLTLTLTLGKLYDLSIENYYFISSKNAEIPATFFKTIYLLLTKLGHSRKLQEADISVFEFYVY